MTKPLLASALLGVLTLAPREAVACSLASPWGLVRHYWVLIKLAMNLLAVGVLLLYMQTLAELAHMARASAATGDAVTRSASPVVHGAAAIVLLLVALVLSVYKPRGRTGWGTDSHRASRADLGTA